MPTHYNPNDYYKCNIDINCVNEIAKPQLEFRKKLIVLIFTILTLIVCMIIL